MNLSVIAFYLSANFVNVFDTSRTFYTNKLLPQQ